MYYIIYGNSAAGLEHLPGFVFDNTKPLLEFEFWITREEHVLTFRNSPGNRHIPPLRFLLYLLFVPCNIILHRSKKTAIPRVAVAELRCKSRKTGGKPGEKVACFTEQNLLLRIEGV